MVRVAGSCAESAYSWLINMRPEPRLVLLAVGGAGGYYAWQNGFFGAVAWRSRG